MIGGNRIENFRRGIEVCVVKVCACDLIGALCAFEWSAVSERLRDVGTDSGRLGMSRAFQKSLILRVNPLLHFWARRAQIVDHSLQSDGGGLELLCRALTGEGISCRNARQFLARLSPPVDRREPGVGVVDKNWRCIRAVVKYLVLGVHPLLYLRARLAELSDHRFEGARGGT